MEEHVNEASAIAVVGMAGRFPGAANVAEFWANLRAGVESRRDLSDDDLRRAGVSETRLADPNLVKSGFLLDDFDAFDAGFFGLSPRDASIMDPQHRLFLETAWEALEDAGHVPAGFAGSIGVYAGCGMNAYFVHNLSRRADLLESVGAFLLRHIGNDKDFLATRVCHALDLRGPSVVVQAACATSLVAIHVACAGLLGGECDLALAGGVTIEIPHGAGYTHHEGELLSPDGRCRAFDARAAGMALGSGVGIVALRRLADARAEGDRVLAIIRGSAVNNDGGTKVGYLAPGVDGQARVIAEALAVAGVSPADVGYVEAHGTGTPLGDPIEVAALNRAFAGAGPGGSCFLGSVKPNVGHLDTAAGVAGFIKVVQALVHRELPPSLHFESPGPHIDFAGGPFQVNATLRPWAPRNGVRRAGVTSFGVGGTNAHVIVEEAPVRPPSGPSRARQVLVLSARTPAALARASERLAARLRGSAVPLADVAFTLAVGRRAFAHRRALIAGSADEAAMRLEDGRGVVSGVSPARQVRVVAVVGETPPPERIEEMRREPAFCEAFDACFAEAAHMPALRRTAFAATYAAGRALESWGVRPAELEVPGADARDGRALAAACLAGRLSAKEALGAAQAPPAPPATQDQDALRIELWPADADWPLSFLARVWAAGADVDWPALFAGETRHRVALPSYPFERARHFIEPPADGPVAVALDVIAGAAAVSAPDVEAALRAHPAVADAAAIDVGEGAPVAYVVYAHGPAAPTPTAMRAYLRGRLPPARVPAHVVEVPHIPRTPRGAVRTEELRDPFAPVDDFVAPSTEAEQTVARIYRDALGVARIGLGDNFFDLGGHSVLAARVLGKLEAALGVRLDTQALVVSTVQQVAAACQRARPAAASSVARTMTPVRFGHEPHVLYGVHHPPARRAGAPRGVVLCPPMGQEHMRAHRAFRQLASRLARAGCHVLRFDPFGTGDSAGDGEDATVERWVADVDAAIDEVKEVTGLSRVSVVGLRLGAALAALAARRRGDIDALALWTPVIDGAAYADELVALGGGGLEPLQVLGYPVTTSLLDGLRAIDLRDVSGVTARRVRVLEGESSAAAPAQHALVDALRRAGVTAERQEHPGGGAWAEVDMWGTALIPHELIAGVVGYLENET